MQIIIITINLMLSMAINQQFQKNINNIPLVNVADERAIYDPELPNASAVMAAICCVSVRFSEKPTIDLALLASDLSHQLMAKEYAESQLVIVIDIAPHLSARWDAILDQLNDASLMQIAMDKT